jgi:hypothetical protein
LRVDPAGFAVEATIARRPPSLGRTELEVMIAGRFFDRRIIDSLSTTVKHPSSVYMTII